MKQQKKKLIARPRPTRRLLSEANLRAAYAEEWVEMLRHHLDAQSNQTGRAYRRIAALEAENKLLRKFLPRGRW